MLRPATPNDEEALLDLGERMHSESIYASVSFNRERARKELRFSMTNGCVFVLADDKPFGVIMGHVKKPWFSDDLVGFEEAFYVIPERRFGRYAAELIFSWATWCIENGAVLLRPTTSCGSYAAERLYGKLGFEPVGQAFMKVVK